MAIQSRLGRRSGRPPALAAVIARSPCGALRRGLRQRPLDRRVALRAPRDDGGRKACRKAEKPVPFCAFSKPYAENSGRNSLPRGAAGLPPSSRRARRWLTASGAGAAGYPAARAARATTQYAIVKQPGAPLRSPLQSKHHSRIFHFSQTIILVWASSGFEGRPWRTAIRKQARASHIFSSGPRLAPGRTPTRAAA